MNAIAQRKNELTENSVLASNFIGKWTIGKRSMTIVLRFQWKVELSGSLLSQLSQLGTKDASGRQDLFELLFLNTQNLNWTTSDTGTWKSNIMAFRSFGIGPALWQQFFHTFHRSYFEEEQTIFAASYDLGPGSSGSTLDFNEANFKLSANLEYRFLIFGIQRSLFTDVGNIDFKDDVLDPQFQFNDLEDLKELAVATGFGLRYDFGFADTLRYGVKTHNPARPPNDRWFKEYNFANTLYNIGINYPF